MEGMKGMEGMEGIKGMEGARWLEGRVAWGLCRLGLFWARTLALRFSPSFYPFYPFHPFIS